MKKETFTKTTVLGPDPYKQYVDFANRMVWEDMKTGKFDASALEVRLITRHMLPLQRSCYLLTALRSMSIQLMKNCSLVVVSGLTVDNPRTKYTRSESTVLVVGYDCRSQNFQVQQTSLQKIGHKSTNVHERSQQIESKSIVAVAKFLRKFEDMFKNYSMINVRFGGLDRVLRDGKKARMMLLLDMIRQRSTQEPSIYSSFSHKKIKARWVRCEKGIILRPAA